MIILRLLEEGKISIEDADTLLTAILQGSDKENINGEMSKKMNEFTQNAERFTKDLSKRLDVMMQELEPKVKKATTTMKERTTKALDHISKELKKKQEDEEFASEEDIEKE